MSDYHIVCHRDDFSASGLWQASSIEWQERAMKAEAQVAAVRAFHDNGRGYCNVCGTPACETIYVMNRAVKERDAP